MRADPVLEGVTHAARLGTQARLRASRHAPYLADRDPWFDGEGGLCLDCVASCGTSFSSFAAAARPDKAGSLAAEFRRTPVVTHDPAVPLRGEPPWHRRISPSPCRMLRLSPSSTPFPYTTLLPDYEPGLGSQTALEPSRRQP